MASFMYPPEDIDKAIDSYASHVGKQSDINDAPYDKASLAEIYHPRVRQLMDLQSQGYTHASWGRKEELGHTENQWYGAAPADIFNDRRR